MEVDNVAALEVRLVEDEVEVVDEAVVSMVTVEGLDEVEEEVDVVGVVGTDTKPSGRTSRRQI